MSQKVQKWNRTDLLFREFLDDGRKRKRDGIRADGDRLRDPKKAANYLKDGDGSDNDERDGEDDAENIDNSVDERAMRMNESLQQLYTTVLSWPIFPVARERPILPNGRIRPLNNSEKLTMHLLTGMRPWLQTYLDRDSSIVADVTKVKTVAEYSNHWKALLPLEIRAALQEGVGQLLPGCKAGIKKRFQDELEQNSFIGTVV